MEQEHKSLSILQTQISKLTSDHQTMKAEHHEEMNRLIKSLESTQKKYKNKKEAFHTLQNEFKSSISPEEHTALDLQNKKMESTMKQMENNLSKVLMKVARLEKEIKEIEDEKQEILIKMVNAE